MVSETEPNFSPVVNGPKDTLSYRSKVALRLVRQASVEEAYWKVMEWAYARGDHITKEHILVYWLAPIEATILAAWTFKLLDKLEKEDKTDSRSKSD